MDPPPATGSPKKTESPPKADNVKAEQEVTKLEEKPKSDKYSFLF